MCKWPWYLTVLFDIMLMIGKNNFVGYLPPEIERLRKLQILDVRECFEFYWNNICVMLDEYLGIFKAARLMMKILLFSLFLLQMKISCQD